MLKGCLIVSVEEDWHPAGQAVIPAGSLLSVDPAAAERGVQVIFTPGASQSIDQVGVTKNTVVVSLFDNVRGRAMRFTAPQAGQPWQALPLALPDMTSIHIVDTDHASDTAFLSVEGYLEPSQLWLLEGKGQPHKVKSAPARFKTDNLVTEQFWATSTDGTRIPYFIVHRRDIKLNGANPTLLTAYGGFQVSYTRFTRRKSASSGWSVGVCMWWRIFAVAGSSAPHGMRQAVNQADRKSMMTLPPSGVI